MSKIWRAVSFYIKYSPNFKAAERELMFLLTHTIGLWDTNIYDVAFRSENWWAWRQTATIDGKCAFKIVTRTLCTRQFILSQYTDRLWQLHSVVEIIIPKTKRMHNCCLKMQPSYATFVTS